MTTQLDLISQKAETNPDSALILLSKFKQEKNNWSEGDRMYYELVKLKAENKAFEVFTTDTIINEVVDYFKNHGTANERMLAYYLQGRVYSDMGEAPQALQAYYDAIECADTTSRDCDYNTLIPVYGQMSQLFHQQNLPHDEIWALRHYIDYIQQYKSAKEYVVEKRRMISPYYLLGKKDSVLQIINDSYKALRDMGENQEAASALVSSIYIYIERGQLDKAHQTIGIYEKESGLFDKSGNIAKGREHYYIAKGFYHLASSNSDSAEYFFRKAIKYGYASDAYKGLLAVYQKRNNIDSVLHYSILNERALDSLHNHMEIDAIHQMSSLYNYSRNQKMAEQEKEKAQKTMAFLNRIILVTIILFFAIIGISWLYRKNRKEKQNKIAELENALSNAKEQRMQIQEELRKLKTKDYIGIIAEKEKQEAELTKQIQLLQAENNLYKNNSDNNQKDDLNGFLNCDTARLYVRKANKQTERLIPNEAEWGLLMSRFAKYAPQTFQLFSATKPLSKLEQRICLLLILDISEKVISIMTESTPSTVSNAKARANEKLFGKKQAQSLKNSLIQALKQA
jgi:preprotein translocase subunit SecG